MNAALDQEAAFVAAAAAFDGRAGACGPALEALAHWHAGLAAALVAACPQAVGLQPGSVLAACVQAVQVQLRAQPQAWQAQWQARAPAHALARALAGRAVLLVYGKVNAGKSSLCNFLAARFAAHGAQVRWFVLAHGRLHWTASPMREGATETTTHIQGVLLGPGLALLDTPGLHSQVAANAQLAQAFTDSADGLLWLSGSGAPGQVRELDALGRQVRLGKPLLPVITRSDRIEEDLVGDVLVGRACNKSDQSRALQEQDVAVRARQALQLAGLDDAVLQLPVSVSVHAARADGQGPQALAAAGFARLYAALGQVLAQAHAYTQRKPAELRLHHLQEDVLDRLRACVLPDLRRLQAVAGAEMDALAQVQGPLVQAAARQVLPALPGLLDRHAAGRQVQAACAEAGVLAGRAFARAADQALAGYQVSIDPALARVVPAAEAAYQAHVVDGPAGSEVVGVSFERLRQAMEEAVQACLAQLAAQAIGQCRQAVQALLDQGAALDACIQRSALDLDALAAGLRAPAPGPEPPARG